MKIFTPETYSFLASIFLLIISTTNLHSQSGNLDRMSAYVDGKHTRYKKVEFSFEIKNQVLIIYDNASGEREVWRYYNLLAINEDSDEVKSYETEYATIRIYFPDEGEFGLKGNLELNIVSHEYHWNWWKFSKKYP